MTFTASSGASSFNSFASATYAGGDVAEFCTAFAETGHTNLANRLCELALQQQRSIATSHTPLVHRFARLLIEQRRFEQAETLMMREDDALTVDSAELLVELYRHWNKLDRLPQELAKFHLPDGTDTDMLLIDFR